jgi:hypothetical protein
MYLHSLHIIAMRIFNILQNLLLQLRGGWRMLIYVRLGIIFPPIMQPVLAFYLLATSMTDIQDFGFMPFVECYRTGMDRMVTLLSGSINSFCNRSNVIMAKILFQYKYAGFSVRCVRNP